MILPTGGATDRRQMKLVLFRTNLAELTIYYTLIASQSEFNWWPKLDIFLEYLCTGFGCKLGAYVCFPAVNSPLPSGEGNY